jgi:hypothetical protein
MSILLTLAQQYELVNQGLAKAKYEGKFVTFKYAKKVMYDYLWKSNPALLECRGHVYDTETGELVQVAPRKTFNYLEDGNWKDVPLDTPVNYMKKYNGFMACATIHQGEVVVSTTGTTSSQYAKWAKELILNNWDETFLSRQYTDLFEIIHQDDPHIVNEGAPKAVYLGTRWKDTGDYVPAIISEATLGEVLALTQEAKHEGFMVWKGVFTGWNDCCKVKTPYYIGKKKLMRMHPSKVDQMYNPSNYKAVVDSLPEIWKDAVYEIMDHFTKEQWIDTPEQNRRKFLETIT